MKKITMNKKSSSSHQEEVVVPWPSPWRTIIAVAIMLTILVSMMATH